MKTACKVLWLVFCFFLFSPVLVQAEHTPEHRFTIYGYVYDDSGKPLSGTVVIRDAANHVLGTTDAGRSGYYQIHLHLHGTNVGDKLIIQSEAGEKDLIVQFDPNDKTTERMAEVNFGMVPPSSGLLNNGAFLFGVAAMVVAGTIYFVRKNRKRQKPDRGKKKGKGQSKG